MREEPARLVDFQPAYEVVRAWSVDVGEDSKHGHLRLAPKIFGGFVYAADPEGRVSAYAADSGRRQWSTKLKTAVSGAVGVGEKLVLVGTRRGQVIALERETGTQAWTAAVSSEVLTPPVVRGDVVVVQSVDGRVYGLSAGDGKRLWVYERTEPALSLRGTGTPLVVSDAVVAGFASGKLVVLRLKDGSVLWEATVSQPRGRNEIERLVDVDTAPLVAADAVYAASFQGKLTALNPRSGQVMWSRDVSTYTDMATDGAYLYVADEKGHVLALDRRNGASLWKQEALKGRRLNAPSVHQDFVVVADYEGYVHWLSRTDGRFVARYRIGGGAVRVPAAADGDTLYVTSSAGKLAALKLVQK